MGKELWVLVDRRDPGAPRLDRRCETHRLAPEFDSPGVRLENACDDLDQRGLSGAVLTHERVYVATSDVKADVGKSF